MNMQCYNCGAEVPEGRTTCPNCAANLTQERPKNQIGKKQIGWNPDGTPIYGDTNKLVGKYRGSEKLVHRLFICEALRMVWVVIVGLFVLSLVFKIFKALNEDVSFSKVSTFTEKLIDQNMTLIIVLLLIEAALLIVLAITFNGLKIYESSFMQVLTAGVVCVLAQILAAVFDHTLFQKIAFSFVTMVVSVLFMHRLTSALSDYIEPLSRTLAKKWRKYGFVYMIINIWTYAVEAIVTAIFWKTMDSIYQESWIHTYGFCINTMIIAEAIALGLLIVEAFMMGKTYKLCKGAVNGTPERE